MDSFSILDTYDEMLTSVDNDPARIQALYETQWNEQVSKAKAKLLDDGSEGVQPDHILVNLLNDSNYKDPRNNLCVWARPTPAIRSLASKCQDLLQKLSPNIWLTPQDCLHVTLLVIAESLTPEALAALVRTLPSLHGVTQFPLDHRARLVKPRLAFDNAGVALLYVPAAGEIKDGRGTDEGYTYPHLQRDIIKLFREEGVEVNARHPPTSCHITLARFITNEDHCSDGKPDHNAMASWVLGIEEINEMLIKEYWPHEGTAPEAGNWVIGEGRDLDVREGTVWYGGGQSLAVGPAL
ncbi:hypothetical protein DL770_005771 [Monosporascus sp. CRB-9-2]|nr:hypothetical protein DL770_005771 [Monosporascus sp. CRB-9-2]